MLRFLLPLLSILLLLGCSERPTKLPAGDDPTQADIQRIDLPKNLLTLDPNAVAFRFNREPIWLCNFRIELSKVWSEKVFLGQSLQLLALTSRGVWEVDHVRGSGSIVADLIPGQTYVLQRRPIGNAQASYELLARLDAARALVGPNLLEIFPEICKFIICAPEMMRAEDLIKKFPDLKQFQDELGLGRQWIGGRSYSTNPCDQCILFGEPPDEDEVDIAIPGGFLPQLRCAGESTVFNADFEADVVGSEPAADPGGDPVGDSIVILGSPGTFTVIDATPLGSKATRIFRTGTGEDKIMDCEIAGPRITTGEVCISYDAYADDDPANPHDNVGHLAISALTESKQPLFHLVFSNYEYSLISGDGNETFVGNFSGSRVHKVELLVDMDRRRFSIILDSNLVADDRRFLPVGCPDLYSLQFRMAPAILEALNINYVTDNIELQKTATP